MKLTIPDRYTVWITRTGREPFVVSLPAKPLFASLAVLLAAVAAAGGGAVRAWNAHQQQQEQLNREARVLLQQLQGMERDLERLRERSGLEGETRALPSAPGGRGGSRPTVSETDEVLQAVRHKYSHLSVELERDVEPALERTLAIEAALPQGLPLKAPTHVTSEFGLRRSPFGFTYEFHDGIDFAGSYGTPVYPTAPGTVVTANFSRSGYGKQVVVEHPIGDGRVYRTRYAHLSEIAVKVGDRVDRDNTIGAVGSTGRSTGTHLHYAIYLGDRAIDPRDSLGTAAALVSPDSDSE